MDMINQGWRASAARSVAVTLCLFMMAPQAQAAPVTDQQKNVVSALYSFDSILAFTGLAFGVDPAAPAFAMSGSVNDAGFAWSVATTYKGEAFAFSAAGTFDDLNGLTNWSGIGSLGSASLASAGVTSWLDESHFSIMDSTSVDGTPVLWSIDSLGQPGANFGTMDINGEPVAPEFHVRDDWTVIRELETRHFMSWLFGPVTDGWLVTVSDDGKITRNVYGLAKEGTTVGVSVGLKGGVPIAGGQINFGGQTLTKVGFISNVPEPSSWALMVLGFGTVGGLARWRPARRLASAV